MALGVMVVRPTLAVRFGGRQVQAMSFLEREPQVEVLLGYAAEAAAGTGRLVLVEGEAGVGKSTLLEQVEAKLRRPRG